MFTLFEKPKAEWLGFSAFSHPCGGSVFYQTPVTCNQPLDRDGFVQSLCFCQRLVCTGAENP